jgi:hypothetical protein
MHHTTEVIPVSARRSSATSRPGRHTLGS